MVTDGVGVGPVALMDDTESWCPVKECRKLEEGLRTKFTDEILMKSKSVEMKKTVRKASQEKLLLKCGSNIPLVVSWEG